MAITYHATTAATGRGAFQQTIDTLTNGLQIRDVSDVLDLLALADTPFLNRVTWGPESGGKQVEWISENLGPGYLVTSAAKATAVTSVVFTTVEGLSTAEAVKQLTTGTLLYTYSSTDGEHGLMMVDSVAAASCTIEWLAATGFTCTSAEAAEKMYILGGIANEGSLPRDGTPRDRTQCSNTMMILRQDVQISGSAKATDYYAVNREDQHQILMRLKEMQRQRERVCLYAGAYERTTTIAGSMNGVLGFLINTSGDEIDTSTTSLTETKVNTVLNELWENGSRDLTWFSALSEVAKFSKWDKNRIRMRINDRRGGGHITSYLSEAGIELDLVPMAKVPKNLAFVLDTSKIHPRAKRGRKAIMEKLGKMGDMDDWQIISEFSLEMRGYNLHQHGMFTRLS